MAYSNDKNVSLVDALDIVIDKGAVVQGDIVVRIADLDLLAVSLKIVIVSMSRLQTQQGKRTDEVNYNEMEDEVYLKKIEDQIEKAQVHINQMINADSAKKAESGLAKLVLTLIKLIVDLVEKEAMRRVERGHLTQIEIQKLGLNLQAIETKIEELRLIFGLKEDDLNLDLGPLGKLR
ncbi:gas vesicle protein GvpJ [Patescibacteria group bacterium]